MLSNRVEGECDAIFHCRSCETRVKRSPRTNASVPDQFSRDDSRQGAVVANSEQSFWKRPGEGSPQRLLLPGRRPSRETVVRSLWKTDRRLKHGETVAWREYRLKVHHLPGQTLFAMGLEVDVDCKKRLFTGDNFYHVD